MKKNHIIAGLTAGLYMLATTASAAAMDMSGMSMPMDMQMGKYESTQPAPTVKTNATSLQAALAPQVIRNDPALPAATGGQWQTIGNLPAGYNSVHVATSPDGRSIILIAGSGNDRNKFAAGTFESYRYDLTTKVFKKLVTPSDLFCAGHAYVGNKLLVVGGTTQYSTADHDFYGSNKSYLLDTNIGVYTPVQNMRGGRWYPATVRMGDGTVVVTSGLGSNGIINPTSELYQPATKTWDLLPGNPNWGNLYPNLFLALNGKLFYSGGHTFGNGNKASAFWDPKTNTFTNVVGNIDNPHRDQSAAFFTGPSNDGRIVVAGGGNSDDKKTLATTAYIDLKTATPTWTAGPTLAHAKMYVLPVNLPSEQTLITGGSSIPKVASSSVLEAQLMSPNGKNLTLVNAPVAPRNYHSAATLAYDGSVYVMGGNPDGAPFETRIERYLPPYMFAADPPTINSVSTPTPTYGASFTINTTSTSDITKVDLIAPMATTHSYDSNQRIVRANIISRTATSVTVQIPGERNLLPPGPWMVFVSDSRGIPNRNAAAITIQ